MAFARLTVFLKDQTGLSWTETMYCSSSVTDLNAARANAGAYLQIRSQMVQKGVVIQGGRVSMDDVAGDSYLVNPPPYGGGSGYYNVDMKGDPGITDVAWDTLLISIRSGGLYRKSFWCSGVPDSVTQIGNIPIREVDTFTSGGVITAFNRAYNAWKDELVSGRWAIKSLAKDIVTSPIKVVTGFAGANSQVTAPGHGLALGDKIRISKCKTDGVNNGNLNGVWVVANVISADSFAILGWNPANLYHLINFGQLRKQVNSLQLIDSVTEVRLASHKRGGRRDLQLGRARNRKK